MSKYFAFINGDGEQTRDFTFVENAVQINIKGMLSQNEEAKNKVYNVAIGENYSVNFLYNSIKEYLQSKIEPIHRGTLLVKGSITFLVPSYFSCKKFIRLPANH